MKLVRADQDDEWSVPRDAERSAEGLPPRTASSPGEQVNEARSRELRELVRADQNAKSERPSGKALSGGVSCGVDRVGDTPFDRPCDRGEAGKGPKPGVGPASRRCADGAMKRVPYARPLSPNDWGEGSGIWHQRK